MDCSRRMFCQLVGFSGLGLYTQLCVALPLKQVVSGLPSGAMLTARASSALPSLEGFRAMLGTSWEAHHTEKGSRHKLILSAATAINQKEPGQFELIFSSGHQQTLRAGLYQLKPSADGEGMLLHLSSTQHPDSVSAIINLM